MARLMMFLPGALAMLQAASLMAQAPAGPRRSPVVHQGAVPALLPAQGTLDDYLRNHCGTIFFRDSPQDEYTLEDQVGLSAWELKFRQGKTWIKANNWGDIYAVGTSPERVTTYNAFDRVFLNICPEFIFGRDAAAYPSAYASTGDSQAIREDYRRFAKWLVENYNHSGKTFVLGGFFEINLYLGFPGSKLPNFPVKAFIDDFTAGVAQGIADAGGLQDLKIYTMLELSNSFSSPDFWSPIQDYLGYGKVDLYGISMYNGLWNYHYNDEEIYHRLTWLKQFAADSAVFGNDNVGLGEFGVKTDSGTGLPLGHERVNYFSSALEQARKANAPYANLFCVADQNSKVAAEGHWGLIGLKSEGWPKSEAWSFFQDQNSGTQNPASPDLAVTDVSWSPVAPKPGDRVTLRARILNQGAPISGTWFGVTFQVDGVPVGDFWAETLTNGATLDAYCTTPWTAVAGPKKITATALKMDTETFGANNARSETLNVFNGPDLVVTDITWAPTTRTSTLRTRGTAMTFRAVVKNQGNAASPAGIGVGFAPDGYSGPNDWGYYGGSIPAGASVTVTSVNTTWKPGFSGYHYVRAYVDNNRIVAETAEDNNVTYKAFTIAP